MGDCSQVITRLRFLPPLRIFSTILVEKCLVAGTYFTQQAVSQNITVAQWSVPVTRIMPEIYYCLLLLKMNNKCAIIFELSSAL